MKNERTPKDEGVLSFVVSIQTFSTSSDAIK